VRKGTGMKTEARDEGYKGGIVRRDREEGHPRSAETAEALLNTAGKETVYGEKIYGNGFA